jgi:hypothetical protein
MADEEFEYIDVVDSDDDSIVIRKKVPKKKATKA